MGECLNRAEEIDKKYAGLLNELKTMLKEERFKWLKQQAEYDEFVLELLNEFSNNYEKLKKALQNEGTLSPEYGIASTKNMKEGKERYIDHVEFMNAIKQAVQGYTGENKKGEKYTFLQSLKVIYKQKEMVAGARNDFEKPGFSIGGKKDIYKSVVLANKVQKLLYEEGNYNKTKEAIKEVISKSKKYSYTKEEIEYAIAIVDGLHIVGRLDAPLSEDDGGEMTGYDEVKSNEDGYLDMERQELLNAFVENFEKKWKLFIAGRGKIDCQWFKVFLSRDILIVLKLEHLNKEERKKYKDLLEPKCTSWCSKRGACPYITYKDGKKITSRDSCYIRYEESTAASGDIELYEHLKKVGDIFYQSVLENTYVKKAYTEDVNNLDDLYRMKLKPRTSNTEVEEDIFLFTDTILGNAIGRDKKAVSVAKKKYEENRPMLFKFFESELFDDSGDT